MENILKVVIDNLNKVSSVDIGAVDKDAYEKLLYAMMDFI